MFITWNKITTKRCDFAIFYDYLKHVSNNASGRFRYIFLINFSTISGTFQTIPKISTKICQSGQKISKFYVPHCKLELVQGPEKFIYCHKNLETTDSFLISHAHLHCVFLK